MIIYPDFECLMRGFLLHHTLRYFIPTLSLLRRVFILTHGCLPHPSSKYFTPHTSGIFRVSASPTGVCLTHHPNILSGLWVFYAGFFASPYTQIFYPDFESFTQGFYPHPRVSASPIIQIFYPDFESFMPGFLLHHTLRYIIPTLSLLRRVPGLTLQSDFLSWLWVFYAGCLVSPYSQIFYPDFVSFTPGFFLHHTLRYIIPTLSLLRRVPGLTLQSDFIPRISAVCSGWVFYGWVPGLTPITHIFYPDFESFTPLSAYYRLYQRYKPGASSHNPHSRASSRPALSLYLPSRPISFNKSGKRGGWVEFRTCFHFDKKSPSNRLQLLDPPCLEVFRWKNFEKSFFGLKIQKHFSIFNLNDRSLKFQSIISIY